MALHPDIQAFFDMLQARNPEPVANPTLEDVRASVALFEEFRGEVPEVPFKEIAVPARDGYAMRVRIYNPDLDISRPALVYYPGRGFIIDAFDVNGYAVSRVADYANAKVFMVDYRICPEADFPIPLYDGYDALECICAHAQELQIDPENISVLGYSSGGQVAAYAASQARANNAIQIKHLILLNGLFDLSQAMRDYDDYEAKDALLVRENLFNSMMPQLKIPADELTKPINSPVYEKDVSGFPQTTFVISEYDGLRNDSEHYYQVLSAQNDGVEKIILEG
jgi:acetyl esterase